MATMSDDETLRRFVIRARRVRAHSLVQDWEGLLRHASGRFEAQLDVSGRATMTSRLPEDEEVFESLASRVRPLTVKSEPIYYVKVFDALARTLETADVDEARRIRMEDLRRAWGAAEIQGTQIQAYAMQSARADGADATNLVSDTQLAAAWLYADLVHADAQGAKKEALAFSLRERYAAAVRVFSHMASLTVATLELLESLRMTDALSIEESAWTDKVVVGASEFVQEAEVFIAPLGSKTPDLRKSLNLGGEWSALTVTELLRQDPANQVHVVLRDETGEEIASYDAAVTRRHPTDLAAEWDVLVAGSVVFTLSFELRGERISDARFLGWEAFNSTNELSLTSNRLLLQMDCAATMAFEVGGQEFLVLGPPTASHDDRRELEVLTQTVEDIVAIEHLTRRRFEPCIGPFDDRDRVRLRRARLVWEGKAVRAMRHPVTVTAPAGNAPQVIVVAEGTLDVGGAEVPTPQTHMWHPEMTATESGQALDVGPDAKTYRMEAPDGTRFFAVSSERVSAANGGTLDAPTPWNLIGINETTFPD